MKTNFETTIKNLVEIQKNTDKVIEELEKLNGELHQQDGDEFSDFYNISCIDTDQLEKEEDQERLVQIELGGMFHRSDENMRGDLKRYGIYRTFITDISPSQTYPVIMDIPENVWLDSKIPVSSK